MKLLDRLRTHMALGQHRGREQIDPMVHALVDALNATGQIRTTASCQGSAIKRIPPYVDFHCTDHVAKCLERELRIQAVFGRVDFGGGWTIQSRFNEHLELTFQLYSPHYHAISASLLAPLHYLIQRSQLDTELKALTRIVQSSAFLQSIKP